MIDLRHVTCDAIWSVCTIDDWRKNFGDAFTALLIGEDHSRDVALAVLAAYGNDNEINFDARMDMISSGRNGTALIKSIIEYFNLTNKLRSSSKTLLVLLKTFVMKHQERYGNIQKEMELFIQAKELEYQQSLLEEEEYDDEEEKEAHVSDDDDEEDVDHVEESPSRVSSSVSVASTKRPVPSTPPPDSRMAL